MSINFRWGDESHSYVQVCVAQSFTMDDIFSTIRRLRAVLASAPGPVDVVCELAPGATPPPDSIAKMPELADHIQTVENLGKVYIVGARGFMRTVTEVFSTVFYPLYHVQNSAAG